MELGRFEEASAALAREVADEAHSFGAALQDMGRFVLEMRVGAFDAALAPAPGLIAATHAVMRAWMLRWIARELCAAAPLLSDAPETLDQIEALITATGVKPEATGAACLLLARGDAAGARALLAKVRAPAPGARLALLLAESQAARAAQDWPSALEAARAGAALAQAHGARHRLWLMLDEQALAEEGAGEATRALATRQQARALWTELAGAIADPDQRAAFLEGGLPVRLRLVREN